MSEIEFRGLRVDGKGWVYGYYVSDGNEHGIIPIESFSRACNGSAMDFYYIEVLPKTVGQYTGLKDKNGVAYFESSLIKDGQGNIGEIFYHDKSTSFLVRWKRKDGTWETDSCMSYGEVIGNIHDNPELLERKAR